METECGFPLLGQRAPGPPRVEVKLDGPPVGLGEARDALAGSGIHLRDARISEMHQGALLFETHGPAHRPDALTGKYWTDRKTVRSMDSR